MDIHWHRYHPDQSCRWDNPRHYALYPFGPCRLFALRRAADYTGPRDQCHQYSERCLHPVTSIDRGIQLAHAPEHEAWDLGRLLYRSNVGTESSVATGRP